MIAVAGACSAVSLRAVMFKSTGDPTYNTNAPSGSLTNSGWQYEGGWDKYLGTPIAPRYLIVAKHVGGSTVDVFNLNGFVYHPVQFTDCPNADLRIWRMAETFPRYAPLYTNSNEIGQHCVVFGRGTQRGAEVIVSGVTNGWQLGNSDVVERWGENDVASIVTGGAGQGDFLYETFDRGAGSNECHLSVGDSSGALFIQDSSTWKLAGIHYAVDGPFSTTGVNGSGFRAALMDYGGLYTGGDGNWTFQSDTSTDKPSGFYSTRISGNAAWINSVIDFETGDDLRIRSITRAGADVQIALSTATNRFYRVERASGLSGAWTSITNNLAGTGGIVTAVDPGGASATNRFYRALILP